MISAREQILARVRAALASLPQRAPLPDWDRDLVQSRQATPSTDLWELFSQRFSAVNGRPLTDAADVAPLLSAAGWHFGYCDPALWPLFSDVLLEPFRVETEYERSHALKYEFGITWATGAIAETGSLILTDGMTSSRLAALAPWVHVAVVERSSIHATIPEALEAHPRDPNIIWVTGPSKTADVEGIMIEGVHGPGVQVALLAPGPRA